MMGVEMAFEALIISLSRGTPKVTFIDATPCDDAEQNRTEYSRTEQHHQQQHHHQQQQQQQQNRGSV